MISIPFAAADALRAPGRIRRQFSDAKNTQVRIALLGGSTTSELSVMLELAALANGYQAAIHESDYGAWFEAATVDSEGLARFAPQFVVFHTSWRSLRSLPEPSDTEQDLKRRVVEEIDRLRVAWDGARKVSSALIIQNNFDFPPIRMLGNLDGTHPSGAIRFIRSLNEALSSAISETSGVVLNDISFLQSASAGVWSEPSRWFAYKLAHSAEAHLAIARSILASIRANTVGPKKCLVLDLDNTLWGGVIGDDGVDRIALGRETAVAEAFTAFQEYCLALSKRGVLLAVCSKNDDAVARLGLNHPDAVLRESHFAAIRANWMPKHENIRSIAEELNLGIDSFVFVDDNPAERALVAAQLPAVAVPEVGSDVTQYAAILDAGRYFDSASLSAEDLNRAALYVGNSTRSAQQSQFASYEEYLSSLEMVARIGAYREPYLERIAQLVNKTNQFNLTTRRYSIAEVHQMVSDPDVVTLYGRLIDRFGDNGLVTLVSARRVDDSLEILDWLMSCRVLKRTMEAAMLAVLLERARNDGVRSIRGRYIPTAKNSMVADHYSKLGFVLIDSHVDGSTTWELDVRSAAAPVHFTSIQQD